MPQLTDPAETLREYLCAHADSDPPQDVLDLHHPDAHVSVGRWAQGYSLWWTDYVATDWREWYPTLSVALARAAALLHCGEHEWTLCFSSASFPESAALFFKEVTQ